MPMFKETSSEMLVTEWIREAERVARNNGWDGEQKLRFNSDEVLLNSDLFSGYLQIEIKEEDKHKTASVCEYGQYEFNRMLFGLTNNMKLV